MEALQKIARKFIDDRTVYEEYAPYLLSLKNTDRDFKFTLQAIHSYYNKYTKANSCTINDLNLFLQGSRINLPQNTKDFIKELKNVDMSNEDLTMDTIEATVEQHIASKILDKVALIIDNNKTNILHTIQDDLDEYVKVLRNPPPIGIKTLNFELGSCIQTELKTKGLPFVSDVLTNETKGAKPGTLGLIFAYVDTGKTSFGVANLIHMAEWIQQNEPQEVRPLVYAGNEESIHRIALRATNCIMRYNDEELIKNEAHAQQMCKHNGFQRIKFVDSTTQISQVERILQTLYPRVLFIDQGTKVRIPGTQTHDVNTLAELFNTYRELCKEYNCCIICMAQADSESDDKQYLDLRNLYGSRSAVQGELDWAVGIGMNLDDIKYLKWRYFRICKTKFGDKKDFACRFDTKRCRFKEVK